MTSDNDSLGSAASARKAAPEQWSKRRLSSKSASARRPRGELVQAAPAPAAGRESFLEEMKARRRRSLDQKLEASARLKAQLSDKERLKLMVKTDAQERPNIALAPVRWNIEKERRIRTAVLDNAVHAFEAGAAARRAAHDGDLRKLDRKIEKRRRRARRKAREDAPKRFALMRESADHLRQVGRFEESEAAAEKAKREEEAYWHSVSGVDFETRATRRIAATNKVFDAKEEAREAEFGEVKKTLLSELDMGTKQVLRANPRTVEDEMWKCAHFAKHGMALRLEELFARRDGPTLCAERDRDTAWTPLFFAARHGHFACVKLLCENGADTRVVDPRGRTPLHLAAAFGSKEILGCLLEHGAKVDGGAGIPSLRVGRIESGGTSFGRISESDGSIAVIKTRAGEEPSKTQVDAEDELGLTAADEAVERGRPADLIEFLEQFTSEMDRRAHRQRLARKRKDPKFLSVLEAARRNTYITKDEPSTADALKGAETAQGSDRTAQNDKDLVEALKKLDFKEQAFGKDYYGLLPTLTTVAAAYRARGDLLGARSSLERSAQIAAASYGLKHTATAAAYEAAWKSHLSSESAPILLKVRRDGSGWPPLDACRGITVQMLLPYTPPTQVQ